MDRRRLLLLSLLSCAGVAPGCARDKEASILCESDDDCADPTPLCNRITGTCLPKDTKYTGTRDLFLGGSFSCPVLSKDELVGPAYTEKIRQSQPYLSGRVGKSRFQDGTSVKSLKDNELLPTNLLNQQDNLVLNFQSICYYDGLNLVFVQYLPDAILQLNVTGVFEGGKKYDLDTFDAVFGLAKVNPLKDRGVVLLGMGNLTLGKVFVESVGQAGEGEKAFIKGRLASGVALYEGTGGLGDQCDKHIECGRPNYNYCLGATCVAFCDDDADCVDRDSCAAELMSCEPKTQFGRCVGYAGGFKMCLAPCGDAGSCPSGTTCGEAGADKVPACTNPALEAEGNAYTSRKGETWIPGADDSVYDDEDVGIPGTVELNDAEDVTDTGGDGNGEGGSGSGSGGNGAGGNGAGGSGSGGSGSGGNGAGGSGSGGSGSGGNGAGGNGAGGNGSGGNGSGGNGAGGNGAGGNGSGGNGAGGNGAGGSGAGGNGAGGSGSGGNGAGGNGAGGNGAGGMAAGGAQGGGGMAAGGAQGGGGMAASGGMQGAAGMPAAGGAQGGGNP